MTKLVDFRLSLIRNKKYKYTRIKKTISMAKNISTVFAGIDLLNVSDYKQIKSNPR